MEKKEKGKKKRKPSLVTLRCGCLVEERPIRGGWVVRKVNCGSHRKREVLWSLEGFF